MKIHLSIEMAFRMVKIMSSPILGWPLPPDAKRIVILKRRIWKIFTLANIMTLVPALVLNMYNNREDHLAMFLGSTDLIAVIGVLMFVTIGHMEANHLHVEYKRIKPISLIYEMRETLKFHTLSTVIHLLKVAVVTSGSKELLAEMRMFLENCTKEELDLIQFYVTKSAPLHVMVFVVGFAAPVPYIVVPFFTNQPLPGRATYPFSIEPFWIWALLYATQSVVAYQVTGALGLTMIFANLTWFSAARFEIVCMNIQKATNENEVKKCLRLHQESLNYADRLSTSVGRTAFAVAASNFIGVILGGLVITYKQFYSLDFVKLMMFMAVATVHLFLYAWPADHLTQSSIRVSESILYGQWIGKSRRMHRSLLIMMLRANDPVVVKVDGLLPALDVETFGTGLSSSFSYVATLLAIFGE